jgi:GH24 family phage-related lysozyme (muramidase)
MKLSSTGLALIAKWEGFRAEPYNDAAGHATIGYGHLLHHGPVTQTDRRRWGSITREEALKLLNQDAQEAASYVNSYISVKLTQGQFDALVSFTFNVGGGALRDSTLRKLVNRKRWEDAALEFHKWVYAGGPKLEGLANRRQEEERLFRYGGRDWNETRKRQKWEALLERDRRIANARREKGLKPWPTWLRVRAAARKKLLER